MFQATSPSVVCPSCGKRNSARVNFCTACAGRLGKEPSITPPPHQAAAAAAPAMSRQRNDSRFDAPRTGHSRPMPIAAPASDAHPLGFWFKFCMTGLVLMIAFITWAIYTMTGSRAVAPLASEQMGAAPAQESVQVATPAAPSQASVASASKQATGPLAAPSIAAAPAAPSRPAASAAAPVPPATQQVAAATGGAPTTSTAAAAAAADARTATTTRSLETRRNDEAAQPQQTAARRQAWRERIRPPAQDADEIAATPTGAWVMPDRPPVSTSAPGFQDAGPPVVQGPGPGLAYASGTGTGTREAALATSSPSRVSTMPSASTAAAAAPTGDLGPPIAVGPGPLYDFSTPGANRR